MKNEYALYNTKTNEIITDEDLNDFEDGIEVKLLEIPAAPGKPSYYLSIFL